MTRQEKMLWISESRMMENKILEVIDNDKIWAVTVGVGEHGGAGRRGRRGGVRRSRN